MHVDSLGRKFKINKVFKVRYLGLRGFNPFLKGKQILVDFEYENEFQNLSLEEFKEELVESVLKKKRFWQSGWDIEELKQKIKKSETFAELAGWLK